MNNVCHLITCLRCNSLMCILRPETVFLSTFTMQQELEKFTNKLLELNIKNERILRLFFPFVKPYLTWHFWHCIGKKSISDFRDFGGAATTATVGFAPLLSPSAGSDGGGSLFTLSWALTSNFSLFGLRGEGRGLAVNSVYMDNYSSKVIIKVPFK